MIPKAFTPKNGGKVFGIMKAANCVEVSGLRRRCARGSGELGGNGELGVVVSAGMARWGA
jgi:hypothetical protein